MSGMELVFTAWLLTIAIPINGLLYLAKRREQRKINQILRLYYNRRVE